MIFKENQEISPHSFYCSPVLWHSGDDHQLRHRGFYHLPDLIMRNR